MDEKKEFKKVKNTFDALKVDPSSVLFSEEILDKKLLNKLRKSKYERDKLFYKLVNLLDKKNVFDEEKLPTRTDYIEKRKIDRSTFNYYMSMLETSSFWEKMPPSVSMFW